jgi:uncharacterized damage-inducible protein DinB
MNSFEYSYVIRRRLGDLARSLSTEQLNKIPEGCNNNIAWHIGHLAVSTELLCYLRSGVQPGRIVLQADQYKNGTKPEAPVSAEEIAQLAERLISSIDTIRQDYEPYLWRRDADDRRSIGVLCPS